MAIKHVLLSALLLLVMACQPVMDREQQQGSKLAVEVLYASQQCGYSQATPEAAWIDDASQLEAGIKQIQRNMPGSRAINLPMPDFEHEIVLLIEMGEKPTLGYGIELRESDFLTVKHGQSQLVLDWVQPPAGSNVAQVVSSPCLLLKLERGNYSSVRVLNRQGVVLAITH